MANERKRGSLKAAPVEGPWELPEGWHWERLGDLGRWGSGGTPKAKDPRYYGGPITWYRIGDLTDGPVGISEQTITAEGLAASSAKIVPAGALLVAMYGSIGKLGITTSECATNQAIAHFLPGNSVRLRWIFFALLLLRSTLIEQGQGGTQQNISQGILLAQPVPVPPLSVQDRYIRRIDELFAEIDDGERAMLDARRGLEVYRRSLIQAAVTGDLTSDWRRENPPIEPGVELLARVLGDRRSRWEAEPKIKKRDNDRSNAGDGGSLASLPDGWAWIKVAQAGLVQLGRQRTPKDHFGSHMRPYLRVANVYEERISTANVKEMNFTPEEFEVFRLNPGDILLNEGQSLELVGRPAMFGGEIGDCCFQNTLIRFVASENTDREFALLVFLNHMHSGRFQRIAKITTNIAHLGAGRFSDVEFPLPPLHEQREIARRYRAQNRGAAQIGLEPAAPRALRQSVLAAAFRGDLVA